MNEQKPLTLKEKLIFGWGDIFGGGGQALIGVLYFYFIVNVIGISAGWAGTVVLISKIWDAVIDPFLGVITDNTRTKIGRRRPFILAGAILLIVAMALVWMPIVGWSSMAWKIVFCTLTYIFYNTVSSVINVPYSSMSAEIAVEPKERNSVNVIRLVFSTVATAVCTLVPTIILGMYKNGTITLTTLYLILVLGFGILFMVPLIFIGLFTRERAVMPKEKSKIQVENFYKPLKIKSFRQLLGMYLAQSISMDILSNGILLFTIYCVVSSSTVVLGIFIGVQVLLFPMINLLINKVDKNKIYAFGLPLSLLGIIGVCLYPSAWPTWGLYAATAILAIGFAGAQLTSWIIFPDAVDAGELKFKERNAGSFSGIMTFCRTLASAIGIWVFGMVLEFTGYVKPIYPATYAPQPDSAITGIRLVMLIAYVVLMTAGFFIARKFALTRKNNEKMRHFLEVQRENKLDDLSETEKADYEALKKEVL